MDYEETVTFRFSAEMTVTADRSMKWESVQAALEVAINDALINQGAQRVDSLVVTPSIG